MTMTRKDFNNLAKDLRWFRLGYPDAVNRIELDRHFDRLVSDIARSCKEANINFDNDRFHQAVYREVQA